MKLSCKSLYAIRALFDLAYHSGGTPAKIEDIARRECVSARFLEQIFKDLKRADIIASKRGPKGGYFLVRRPEEITLGEVIRLLEGTMEESMCRDDVEGDSPSVRVTQAALQEVAEQVRQILDGVTIEDLAQRGEQMGVQREGYKGFVYVI
ncbi:MAG: Rrf2 family transcriptional regulator [Myxococcales bacterium]|nr:Rrf2 family transcriptional regulator [Myxococcales bacterium]